MADERHPRRRTVLAFALLAAGATFHAFFGYAGAPTSSVHAAGTDDAYISFRYARNLTAGEGLVFNPGGRVEGYSNLLFVLFEAALLGAGVPDGRLYGAVSAANVVFALGALAVFASIVRRRFGPGLAATATLWVAAAPVVWLWAASGMESVLVVLLLLLLWRALETTADPPTTADLAGLAAVSTLLVLARAEGFLYPLVAVAHGLLTGRRRLAALVLATASPAVVGLFAWRLAYYGEWLPNPVYAKVAGPPLARVAHAARQLLEVGLGTGLLVSIIALVVLAVVALRRRDEWGKLPFEATFALFLLVYWHAVGGDHFGERFLLVLIPMGAAAVVGLLVRFGRERWIAVAGIAIVAWQALPLAADGRFAYRRDRYDAWIALGRHLAVASPPDALLATGAAGKVPFFSRLPTLDMRGLTDRRIARAPVRAFTNPGHDREDLDYVLARRPAYLAAWVAPSLDLGLGLDEERYRAAGYRLWLLVDTGRERREPSVVDVAAKERAEVADLVRRGYRYGVLRRDGG